VLLAYLQGTVGAPDSQEGVAALALECTWLAVHVLHKEKLLPLLDGFGWDSSAFCTGLLA
jgi:hypothetical protein